MELNPSTPLKAKGADSTKAVIADPSSSKPVSWLNKFYHVANGKTNAYLTMLV